MAGGKEMSDKEDALTKTSFHTNQSAIICTEMRLFFLRLEFFRGERENAKKIFHRGMFFPFPIPVQPGGIMYVSRYFFELKAAHPSMKNNCCQSIFLNILNSEYFVNSIVPV